MGLVDEWHEKYAKGHAVRYIFDHTEKGRGEIADIWKMLAEFARAQRQRKKVGALFAELKNQIGLRYTWED
jgi:hypothetical protein